MSDQSNRMMLLLAKAFRATADAYVPTQLQPAPQVFGAPPGFGPMISAERDQQEKIVWSVLCAIASTLESVAKEIGE